MSFELITCAVTHLRIDFVAPSDFDGSRGAVITMNFDSGIARHVTELRKFKIFLTAKFSEHTEDKIPLGFQVDTSITGFVRVSEDIPDEKVAAYAHMNGVNSLYGTLRGVIMSATGVFPTGPMILKSRTAHQIIGVPDPSKAGPEKPINEIAKVSSRTSRPRRKPVEEGVASGQRVFSKVLAKADPVAEKPAKSARR